MLLVHLANVIFEAADAAADSSIKDVDDPPPQCLREFRPCRLSRSKLLEVNKETYLSKIRERLLNPMEGVEVCTMYIYRTYLIHHYIFKHVVERRDDQ